MDDKFSNDKATEVSSSLQDVSTNIEHGTSRFVTEREQKELVRKIDIHLMPLLIISYGLQYLDKTSLAYSAILGIRKDLHLVADEYSWASSIFYAGYLVASYPVCAGFVKFPLGKYLSLLIFLWGIVLTLHAVVHNATGLMVVRFFLGALESAISPGFSLITGMWYIPKEHVSRHSFWFAGNATASIIGSMVTYGILHYHGGFQQWRILFLIFGLITVSWSIVLWFYLPDSPSTAYFLNAGEQEVASLRPKKFQHTTQNKKYNFSQLYETLLDPQAWWFLIFVFVICIPNGGTTSFSTIIINSFGYDKYQTILMGLPASALQLAAVLICAILTTTIRKSRIIVLSVIFLMGTGGILMIKFIDDRHKLQRLAGFWLTMAIAPAFPLMLSLAASNFAGFTKKSTVMAMIFLAYCGGNWAGPLFFKSSEAPNYHTAYTVILICFALSIGLLIVLRLYLMYENARRNKEQGVQIDAEETRQIDLEFDSNLDTLDETDKQNKSFRYVL